ncbi:MAG: hypothetical protein AB8B87_03060 [Granulosicoccus sp.]
MTGTTASSGANAFANSSTTKSATPTPAPHKESSSTANQKALLQAQITSLEAKARAANQSDLELRRLRSELESVQADSSSEAARLDAIADRIREQEAALASIDQSPKSTADQSQNDANGGQQRANESSPARRNTDVASAKDAKKTPLFQAPAERDDLKLIKGIGPVMERTLNELGVTTFRQLADFTQLDIDKVSEAIGAFPGRIERDDWVGKAKLFVRDKSSV